jgi:homoserine dehydrogenase
MQVLHDPEIAIVVEPMEATSRPVPSADALQQGKHVVTANKPCWPGMGVKS